MRDRPPRCAGACLKAERPVGPRAVLKVVFKGSSSSPHLKKD
jgi:hypothetical protein